MREILFRGKRVDNGEWVEGVPTKDAHGEMVIIESVFECEEYLCRGANCLYVDENTVGQYTGLTDKNGKKIFEGDIVKGRSLAYVMLEHWGVKDSSFLKDKPTHTFYQIKFNEGKYQLFTLDNKSGAILNYGQNGEANTLEVIGNIHDNPELLKGE